MPVGLSTGRRFISLHIQHIRAYLRAHHCSPPCFPPCPQLALGLLGCRSARRQRPFLPFRSAPDQPRCRRHRPRDSAPGPFPFPVLLRPEDRPPPPCRFRPPGVSLVRRVAVGHSAPAPTGSWQRWWVRSGVRLRSRSARKESWGLEGQPRSVFGLFPTASRLPLTAGATES